MEREGDCDLTIERVGSNKNATKRTLVIAKSKACKLDPLVDPLSMYLMFLIE